MSKQVMRARLPVIDVFDPPYNVAIDKDVDDYDCLVEESEGDNLNVIHSASLAAHYVLDAEDDIPLVNFITRALSVSSGMAEIRSLMPDKTPKHLVRYQTKYPNYDTEEVEREIRAHGALLGNGQTLFHGGVWPDDIDELVTSKPLSSSFCPLAALKNALHKGKAYHAGRVDLLVLTAVESETPVYIFGEKGEMKHEKEVLFAAGAKLKLTKRTLVKNGVVSAVGNNSDILRASAPFYVIEAEIS